MRKKFPTAELREIAPSIVGVSIGSLDDKETWRIDWNGKQSSEEEAAVAAFVAAYDPDAPTRAQINAERDRRAENGFIFNGVKFQSRLQDQKRITGAGILASIAISQGSQPGDLYWHGEEEPFVWISAENVLVPMDAYTVIQFGKTAAEWESKHVFAAHALKNLTPIPKDYQDDKYWP